MEAIRSSSLPHQDGRSPPASTSGRHSSVPPARRPCSVSSPALPSRAVGHEGREAGARGKLSKRSFARTDDLAADADAAGITGGEVLATHWDVLERGSPEPGASLGTASFYDLMFKSDGSKGGALCGDHVFDTDREPVLLSPGAGIFFFWQVGAVRYLLDNFEGVEDMRMVGASAGALISTLTACGVAPETTLLEAYRLTLEMGVWGRPLGLLGLWGDLVRAWLDRLLPEDAGERCSGRVALVVTRLPGLQLEGFHRFRSKSDLVDATMASAHVPFFLDFKGWSTFRGMACMDGSLVEFLSNGRAASYEPFVRGAEHAGIDLDYFYDEELQWSRADFLKLRSYEDVVGLYAKGYDFARRLDREGRAPAMARMARRPAPLAAGPDTEALLAAGRAIEAELAQARAAAAAEGLN